MRPIVLALMLLAVVHVLAAIALVGWLAATDRLDRERIDRTIAMFSQTLEEEQRERAEERELAERIRSDMEEAAYLDDVADGPITLAHRLMDEREEDERSRQRAERLQREIDDLRRQLARAQQRLVDEREELEARREAFEDQLERERELREDEQFQQAVRMYEELRPAQAKEMFQVLLEQGEQERVVDYLASMRLRQAGRVLQQFREPDEIEQAATLVERLRERGVDVLGELEDETT